MNEEFIQSDRDLCQVLENLRRDELGILVVILREASSCWLDKSCRSILEIADEIQRLGGVSGLNTLRGHGVKYREIVTDVASKIGAKVKNVNDIAEMEWQVILTAINKVKTKVNDIKKAQLELELREILSSCSSVEIWPITNKDCLSNHVRLKIAKLVKSIVFDKLFRDSFISSIFNKTLFITGVAYKATIPAVFFIAEARLKMKCKPNKTTVKERPESNVERPSKPIVVERTENEEVDGSLPGFYYEHEDTTKKDVVVKGNSSEDERLREIKRKTNYIITHKPIRKISDILATKIPVWQRKGVYAWYFDELPPYIPSNEYININGWTLLYVGIAGEKRPDSSGTLQSRIKEKHLANGGESSLRYSLGALLTGLLQKWLEQRKKIARPANFAI